MSFPSISSLVSVVSWPFHFCTWMSLPPSSVTTDCGKRQSLSCDQSQNERVERDLTNQKPNQCWCWDQHAHSPPPTQLHSLPVLWPLSKGGTLRQWVRQAAQPWDIGKLDFCSYHVTSLNWQKSGNCKVLRPRIQISLECSPALAPGTSQPISASLCWAAASDLSSLRNLGVVGQKES